MNLKDKFNITAEEKDAALCEEQKKQQTEDWWEAAMFTESAKDSER